MIGSEIIAKFELYTDDTTELSSNEELALANDKHKLICQELPWEFLRVGVTINTGSDGKIDAPADFLHFMHNYSEDQTQNLPDQSVVYVGQTPYFIVPMGARNLYNGGNPSIYGNQNVCWYNPGSAKIEFQTSPGTGVACSFDYQKIPADFVAGTSPAGLPSTFHQMIIHAMLVDDEIIQKSEKARSNMKENEAMYQKMMTNLKHYNAKLFFVS